MAHRQQHNIHSDNHVSDIPENALFVADENGLPEDSGVQVLSGSSGGSMIRVVPFTTDPPSGELELGDFWILDTGTQKWFKYYDGEDIVAVEMD